MNTLLSLLLFVWFSNVSSYLQPHQLKLIRSIMSNPQTQPLIRAKTQYILIKNYLPYAMSLSRQFRENLKSKKYIINQAYDLHQYAIQGLVHSVQRYNGSNNVNLHPYAKKDIMGYLYYGVTELSPLRRLTHHQRYTRKIKLPPPNLSSDIWFYDRYMNQPVGSAKLSDKALDIYHLFHKLSPEQKRILLYRYDLTTLKKLRTWQEVAELMACSTETLRKKVNQIRKISSNFTRF